MVNFALLQMDIKYCDAEVNFATAKKMFAEAMQTTPRPDIVVLPEDWSSGFSDVMFHEQEKHVEPEDGPSVTCLKQLAKEYGVWVVAGSIGT
ncbi:MAG: nitrilase-related carbon-nitrogen hydrolase, partial [Pygmaiobacter sp.]